MGKRRGVLGLTFVLASALGAVTGGCRSPNRPEARRPEVVLSAPPQVASLEQLATEVAKVLDERRAREAAPSPSPQAAPLVPSPALPQAVAREAPSPSSDVRPPEVQAPAPTPPPVSSDIDRMSVDELTAVVEQVLSGRRPAAAPEPLAVPGRVEPAAEPPSADPMVRLVAQALRERTKQKAAAPSPIQAEPPPALPATDRRRETASRGPEALDEALVRALVRELRRREERTDAVAALPREEPPPDTASKGGEAMTVDELIRAVEKAMREESDDSSLGLIGPQSAAPPTRRRSTRTVARPTAAGALVRMQSSSIDADPATAARKSSGGRSGPPPSESEIARVVARVLRARSDAQASSKALATSTGTPTPKASVPSPPAARDAEIRALALRIAIAIKSRRGAEAGRASPSPGPEDHSTVPSDLVPAPKDPALTLAQGEAVALGAGSNPYDFVNPFGDAAAPPCSSCGRGHFGPIEEGPGRPGCGKSCYDFPAHTVFGEFFGELYHSICCPDECYEPKWLALANSAFFVDGVRPVTQQRIRYTGINDLQSPDRNEYFFARADGDGPGPTPLPGRATVYRRGQGVRLRSPLYLPSIDLNQVSLYTEVANSAGTVSAFVEIPYLTVRSDLYPYGSGFGNLNAGAKSILFDSPLLQLAFQFRTHAPIGPVNRGTSNGHATLEPSLIAALRLSERTYLQGQLAEWIPLGGTPGYQGSLMDYHVSLNHRLLEINPDIPLIGTLEYSGYSFQTGGYSTFAVGEQPDGQGRRLYSIRQASGGDTYSNLATGLRMVVCDKIDFGAAVAYPLGRPNWMNPEVVAEFRWRF